MRTLLFTAILLIAASTPADVRAASGYAGQQAREIKALSAEEIADLLGGRGLGMAKPAELNHHPGPAHVLELRDQLGLSPDQVQAVQASFERMSAAAKPLGAEMVDRERALDRGFAEGRMTPEALVDETAAIGALQGKLRAVHLAAHLEMRTVLTPAQIARYDELRAYTENAPASTHQHRGHGG